MKIFTWTYFAAQSALHNPEFLPLIYGFSPFTGRNFRLKAELRTDFRVRPRRPGVSQLRSSISSGCIPDGISKAGLVAMTRGLVKALAPEVHVNAK